MEYPFRPQRSAAALFCALALLSTGCSYSVSLEDGDFAKTGSSVMMRANVAYGSEDVTYWQFVISTTTGYCAAMQHNATVLEAWYEDYFFPADGEWTEQRCRESVQNSVGLLDDTTATVWAGARTLHVAVYDPDEDDGFGIGRPRPGDYGAAEDADEGDRRWSGTMTHYITDPRQAMREYYDDYDCSDQAAASSFGYAEADVWMLGGADLTVGGGDDGAWTLALEDGRAEGYASYDPDANGELDPPDDQDVAFTGSFTECEISLDGEFGYYAWYMLFGYGGYSYF